MNHKPSKATNMAFSAMLAKEYKLIGMSLSAEVRAEGIKPNDRIYYQLH